MIAELTVAAAEAWVIVITAVSAGVVLSINAWKSNKKLGDIKVLVNGRLDKALGQIKELGRELDEIKGDPEGTTTEEH